MQMIFNKHDQKYSVEFLKRSKESLLLTSALPQQQASNDQSEKTDDVLHRVRTDVDFSLNNR